MNLEIARLFLGFSVVPDSSLAAAIKRLKIGAQKHEMAMHWAPTSNLHVTTNFLGETARAELPRLLALLEAAAKQCAPTSTSLRGLGAFPDAHHMRVLWAGVRKSRGLAALQENLAAKLQAAGFPQEDREYLPHLTLARLRKARSGQDLISPFVRTSFQNVEIQSVTLFESVLEGHAEGMGPVYKILRTFVLTGSPEPIAE